MGVGSEPKWRLSSVGRQRQKRSNVSNASLLLFRFAACHTPPACADAHGIVAHSSWARTDEMVFLEHEQELRAVEQMRLEDVAENSHGMSSDGPASKDGAVGVESAAAMVRSLDTVKAAERLMTSLDIVTEEEARLEAIRKTQARRRCCTCLATDVLNAHA